MGARLPPVLEEYRRRQQEFVQEVEQQALDKVMATFDTFNRQCGELAAAQLTLAWVELLKHYTRGSGQT